MPVRMIGIRACSALSSAFTFAAAVVTLNGQAPSPVASMKFEVASVKRLQTNADSVSLGAKPLGTYYTVSGPLQTFLQTAYQVPPNRQIGGPDWLRTDTYSINAKVPDGVPNTPENVRIMLRALLAERFMLTVHDEQREMPIYALVKDRKLGPKIQPSTCTAQLSAERAAVPPNPAGVKWERDPRCGQVQSANRGGARLISVGGFPIGTLVDALQYQVDRLVVNRTELTGTYVIELIYAPSQPGVEMPDLPPLTTAIRDQLGLKLEATRAPARVLVVDRVERPTTD